MLDVLDHLDRLDDATPPAGDAVALAHVRGRAAGLRRRRRLTAASALVVIAAAAGGAAIAHGSAHRVNVVGPSTTPTTSPAPALTGETVSGTLPDGLPVQMAEDPWSSVVLGAGRMLTDIDLLRRVALQG